MDEHSAETPAQGGFWSEHKPQDQQGAGEGEGSHAGGDAPSGSDLLAALEQRWESVSQSLRALRQENQQLREQTQQRDHQIAEVQGEVERLNRLVADLQQEKGQTITRIEALLTRFNAAETQA
ncbi:MAG: hypothetical protein HQL63_14045 [Magnetococcales bacterium]|nr:hypothetical protein [Magnetococcales bacterium]MBF0322403.1 hypothetical protein [Magnetococcales bacterium]